MSDERSLSDDVIRNDKDVKFSRLWIIGMPFFFHPVIDKQHVHVSKIRPQPSPNRDSDWKFDKLQQICFVTNVRHCLQRTSTSRNPPSPCRPSPIIFTLPWQRNFTTTTTKMAPSCNRSTNIFIQIVYGKYG